MAGRVNYRDSGVEGREGTRALGGMFLQGTSKAVKVSGVCEHRPSCTDGLCEMACEAVSTTCLVQSLAEVGNRLLWLPAILALNCGWKGC